MSLPCVELCEYVGAKMSASKSCLSDVSYHPIEGCPSLLGPETERRGVNEPAELISALFKAQLQPLPSSSSVCALQSSTSELIYRAPRETGISSHLCSWHMDATGETTQAD